LQLTRQFSKGHLRGLFSSKQRPNTAESAISSGRILLTSGKTTEAKIDFEQALLLLERQENQQPRDQLAPSILDGKVAALSGLASCVFSQDRKKAADYLFLAIEFQNRKVASVDREIESRRMLVGLYQRAGDACIGCNQEQKAVECFSVAIKLSTALSQATPDPHQDEYQCTISLERLGDLHRWAKKETESRALYDRNFGMLKNMTETHPQRLEYVFALSVAYDRMGETHIADRNTQAATDAYKASCELREGTLKQKPDSEFYAAALAGSLEKIIELESKSIDYNGAHKADSAKLESLHQNFMRAIVLRESIAKHNPSFIANRLILTTSYESCARFFFATGLKG